MFLGTSACLAQAPGDGGQSPVGTWRLTALDGLAPAAPVVLTLDEDGTLHGQAPCNIYSGSYTRDGSAFATGPVLSTRMACPEIAQENAYFAALNAATRWAISEGALRLEGEDGAGLLFTRLPNDG